MKKSLLVLGLGLLISGSFYLTKSENIEIDSQVSKESFEIIQVDSNSESIDSSKSNIVTTQDSSSDQLNESITEAISSSKYEKEYREKVQDLALIIDEHKLDIDLLNDQAADLSFEDFIATLPKRVAQKYIEFKQVIGKIQQESLKEDGMDASFFTSYQVQTPEWIQNRKEQLEAVSLPNPVLEVVEKGLSEDSISNELLSGVLEICGKGNSNCIEKAVISWIDANHSLTDDQHQKIKEYL